MAAFIPGESPPLVNTAIRFMFLWAMLLFGLFQELLWVLSKFFLTPHRTETVDFALVFISGSRLLLIYLHLTNGIDGHNDHLLLWSKVNVGKHSKHIAGPSVGY